MLHSPSRVSALALALLGSSLLASSGVGAAEVAPTVSVGYTILNLYRSGLNAVDDTCPIFSQNADGNFRAVDLGPTEYRNPLVKFAVLVHAADDFSLFHPVLP